MILLFPLSCLRMFSKSQKQWRLTLVVVVGGGGSVVPSLVPFLHIQQNGAVEHGFLTGLL